MPFRFFLTILLPGSLALLLGSLSQRAEAQTVFHNISNVPFRAVSSGPQSAYILDVKNAADAAEVKAGIHDKVVPSITSRNAALKQELNVLRLKGIIKRNQQLDLCDTVLLRQNGKIVTPPAPQIRRGPGDELTFNIATTGTGAFSQADAADLQAIINLIYPELRDNILGRPGWTGTVTINNLDPTLGTINEPVGALLVISGSGVEIDFPTFGTYGFRFLAMAQALAQAFHARQRIAYDAFELGMARAAAVVAAVRLTQAGKIPGGVTVDPANGFYYTPYYDLLNQPPLANNTFLPASRAGQPFVITTLSAMLVPRLQMSSTAWLKCFIENPAFFKIFNTGTADGLGTGGYYAAYTANNNTANDVSLLRPLLAAAVPNVEGQDFNSWFEQQYVLNTSVTPGPKLFASTQPTFPTNSSTNDSGAAFFLVYYQTAQDGNETDLSGTVNVIYWDYTFANRLFLPTFDTVTVTNGFGTVAPFFANIGSNDQQRVAVDFPVNKETVRVYFPTGQTGLDTDPNNFSGVTIGADTGTLTATFEGGSGSFSLPVTTGEFGGKATTGQVPTNFSRTMLTFTPAGGAATIFRFQRNVFVRPQSDTFNAVAPIFALSVPGPVDTLTHTFLSGPQMISLPIKPLSGNLAVTLSLDPAKTLLAEYRQDLTTDDKYLHYPSLPLYQPGNAFWSNFNPAYTASAIRGERTDIQKYISIPLLFGWNQIGPPYNQNLTVGGDLTFQYLGGDVLTLADAISQNYVAPGIFTYISFFNRYEDVTSTTDANVPLNTLEAWKGYWIRVLVTEGLTITYANPSSRAAPRSRAAVKNTSATDGWQVPLYVQDADGNRTSALFGQARRGSDSYVPSLQAAAPPPITRGVPTLSARFPHPDWDTGQGIGGDFIRDIRRSNTQSQWNLTVTVPRAEQEYTLGWSDTRKLPRGTRLTLVDVDTGTRQLMNNISRYTFRVGKAVTERHFQIIAEPNAAGKLRISNVVAGLPVLPNGRAARTISISYELSAGAQASVTIRQNGRAIRHLQAGRAANIGANQAVWDLRDDAGIGIAGGTYTLEITAQSPEGDVTRTVTPLLITR